MNFALAKALTTYIFLIIVIITTCVSAQDAKCKINPTDPQSKSKNVRVVGFIRQKIDPNTQINWNAYTHIVVAYAISLSSSNGVIPPSAPISSNTTSSSTHKGSSTSPTDNSVFTGLPPTTAAQGPGGSKRQLTEYTQSLMFDDSYIDNLISIASSNGVSVIAAFGDYGNNTSSIWKSIYDDNAAKLTDMVKGYIDRHNIDGIDIEFPKIDCLQNDPNDPTHQNFSLNFINALKQLSTTLKAYVKPKTFAITVTVGPNDYLTIPGIAGLVDLVNWVNVIGYRLNIGLYKNINVVDGPTSPLENPPGQGSPTFLTFKDVATGWAKTMVDPKRVVMGVELSGIIRKVFDINGFQQNPINQVISVNKQATIIIQNSVPMKDNCDNTLNYINSISWNDLRYSSVDILSNDCTSSGNWIRLFDNATKSTLLYNNNSNADNFYISYEDPQSLQYKIGHIQDNSLGGIMISDISAADNTHNDDYMINNMIQSVRNSSELKSKSGPTTSTNSGTNTSNTDSNNASGSNSRSSIVTQTIGIIIGVIVGVAVIICAAVFLWWYRKRKQQQKPTVTNKSINDYQNLTSAEPATTIPMSTAPPPNSKGSPVVYVTALYDYEGKEDTDISFKKGDVIEVLEKGEGVNDWWMGRINGKVGEFPGNYVRE